VVIQNVRKKIFCVCEITKEKYFFVISGYYEDLLETWKFD